MREREAAGRSRYLLVGLLALVVYVPSLGNGFVLDDVLAVRDDSRIRDLRAVPALLSQPYLTYMPAARSPYRPVTTVSYALSWSMGGGSPFWFHATNVALHVAASLLVLALLGVLGAPAAAATLGAALFAAHPVHVEAVAGVVGRADVLATSFMLAALVLWLSNRGPVAVRATGVALLYLLALGSKEAAVVLPALLVLVTALRATVLRARPSTTAEPSSAPGHHSIGAALASTLPALAAMMVPLAIFLAARRAVLGSVVQLDVASYIAILPPTERVTTAVANLAELLRLLVFPSDLSPDYGPAVLLPAGPADLRFWGGAATILLALTVVAIGIRRAGRGGLWVAAGVAWIAIAYALLSNLILPMPMWLAERTLYLASVGVGLCVVGMHRAAHAAGGLRLRAGRIAAVSAVLIFGAHSARHSTVWRSEQTLFTDLAERHPESFRAQWWVGGRFMDAGDLERGVEWLRRAHETSPNSALLALDYARALLLTGRGPQAEAIVRPIPPAAHPSRSVFLAQSLVVQGREAEAAEAVRVGLGHFPDDPRLREQARQLGLGG